MKSKGLLGYNHLTYRSLRKSRDRQLTSANSCVVQFSEGRSVVDFTLSFSARRLSIQLKLIFVNIYDDCLYVIVCRISFVKIKDRSSAVE